MSGYFFSLVGGVNAGIGRSELVLGDLESDRTFFSGTSGERETEGIVETGAVEAVGIGCRRQTRFGSWKMPKKKVGIVN